MAEPRRHQVTELPPIEAHVTEYRCHRRVCPACGAMTQAALPAELEGQFGPQLTALIAYLTVVCRLPRAVVQRLLEGALQISMSLGSTQKAWEEASAAVAVPYEALQDALPQQRVLNADETGHRTNGDKRWMWALVPRPFVFYQIATSRGSDVPHRLLGPTFAGTLGSDRLPTYLTYAHQRQFCWSHFTRNLLSAQELAKTPSAKRFCREALALQKRLFRLWHRFTGDPHARGAPLTRQQLITKVLPIEKKFFALAAAPSMPPTAMCGTSPARCSCICLISSRSCMRRESSRGTTRPNARSGRLFNDGRSCSARAAPTAKPPWLDC
jgi:transposase